MNKGPELTLEIIEELTVNVEEFISVALANDFEYEDIFKYMNTKHKG